MFSRHWAVGRATRKPVAAPAPPALQPEHDESMMDDIHSTEAHRAQHDPCRVVCVGDGMLDSQGASLVLERLCRVDEPELPWKFWHLGEKGCTAERLRAESVWRVFDHDAGRLVVSLGGAELVRDPSDPAAIAASCLSCLDLLVSKGRRSISLVLPCPSLWPSVVRPSVQALRQELSAASRGRWDAIDAEPRAAAFVAAQAAHPDDASALVDEGPVLTHLGALLLAQEIRRSWATK